MPTAQMHAKAIATSSFLSRLPLIGREEADMVQRLTPADLIPALADAGVDFMLVGAHGLGGWVGAPRATQDVDFLILPKDRKRAAQALLRAIPGAGIEEHPDVWRVRKGGEYLADLILARSPLYRRIVGEFKSVTIARRKTKIPNLEAALAMKFVAMTGHYRKPSKKLLDGHDFLEIVEANPVIRMEFLCELGELAFAGGGAHILEMVGRAKKGERLEI